MIHELDMVVLTRDLPEFGFEAGDVGTVVLVHRNGAGFEVEFVTYAGETLAIVTLLSGEVRQFGPREIAHARSVA